MPPVRERRVQLHALRPDPADLALASPELLERVRADPYNYFRFVNHEWTARVCDIFARDLAEPAGRPATATRTLNSTRS